MIYYFLPGNGIFGGVKVGYQLVDVLNSFGVSACIASPGGLAAQWFPSQAPVINRDDLLAGWKSSDIALFSLPSDYQELRSTCERLIFHCQGTDPAIESFESDYDMVTLSCWKQATDYFRDRGIQPVEVRLGISDTFFYSGQLKRANSISFMPRRGRELFESLAHGLDGWSVSPIDGLGESGVARQLTRSTHFVATSPGEWFGLPALEAMAAGCVVLSPEVLGGTEYLRHGETALVGDWPDLREYLTHKRPSGREEAELAQRGMAMAHVYSMSNHKKSVRKAVDEGVFS